jgi:hypothetical protein
MELSLLSEMWMLTLKDSMVIHNPFDGDDGERERRKQNSPRVESGASGTTPVFPPAQGGKQIGSAFPPRHSISPASLFTGQIYSYESGAHSSLKTKLETLEQNSLEEESKGSSSICVVKRRQASKRNAAPVPKCPCDRKARSHDQH